MHILVMGVSGSGKTTIAALLAGKLDIPFLEADDFHPLANIAKLEAGVPLTDTDRWPWLQAINDTLVELPESVLACSALKAKYREVLLQGVASPLVVYLHGSRELIARRLATRHGHFASPLILESQFADLEEPEDALVVEASETPEAIVREIMSHLPGRPRQQ